MSHDSLHGKARIRIQAIALRDDLVSAQSVIDQAGCGREQEPGQDHGNE